MSRAATGDTVIVKASNNIYTVLVVVATVAQFLGLIAIFLRAKTLFPTSGLF